MRLHRINNYTLCKNQNGISMGYEHGMTLQHKTDFGYHMHSREAALYTDYQLLLLQKQFIGPNEAAVYFILNSPDEFNFVVMQGNDKMQKICRDEYFTDIIGAVAMYYELLLREEDTASELKELSPKTNPQTQTRIKDPCYNTTKSGIVQSWNPHNAFGILREEKSKLTVLFHITGKKTKNWIPEKGDRVQYKTTLDKMKQKEIAVDVDYIGDTKVDLRDHINKRHRPTTTKK